MTHDGESVEFRLRRCTRLAGPVNDREDALRTMIRALREAGFCVGLTEVAIDIFDGENLTGSTLVGPLEQVCEQGPVPVEP